MVDVVRVKPELVRGRVFPKGRSGGIRAFQPEDEPPLQTAAGATGCHITVT